MPTRSGRWSARDPATSSRACGRPRSRPRRATSRSVPGIPLGVATPLDRVGVRSALGLAEYSVEAWAELAVPGPPIVVTRLDGAAPSPPPRPDAIRIETTADPEAGRLP